MKEAISTFSYSFDRSYFENFLANRLGAMRNTGNFLEIYERLWLAHDGSISLDGVAVNNGVDVKDYVQQTYNGAVPLCMIDALAKEILNVIGSVLGCGVAKAIFEIIDWFTDLFGTFICTATIENIGTECGEEFLKALKTYRDTEIMTYKDGVDMVRYYSVLGPKIVAAINADLEKHTVYTYLWNNHIHKLGQLVQDNNKGMIIHTYFAMMDEMATKYNIKVSAKFDEWVVTSKLAVEDTDG